jgi:outer membrane protein
MKYKCLILVASITYSGLSFATTLDEALAMAYDTSPELKAAQDSFMSEIEAMPQALSGFMPQIGVEVGVSDQKTTSVGRFGGSIARNNRVNRNIALKQPLFDGGSTVAAVKAAQAGFRASRGKLYSVEQNVLLNAVDAYLSYYEAEENYNITNASVEFNKQTLEAAEARLKLGEATRTDVALARAKFFKAASDKAGAFANLQSRKALIIKTFGAALEELTLPEEPANIPDTQDALLEKSIAMNPNMQQAKNNVSSAKANSFVAKGALLPSADFTAQLGRNYNNPDNPENLTNANTRTFTTALNIHIPILSKGGAEYSSVRKANAIARASAHQLEDQLGAVKVNAISSWEGYQASKSAIAFAKEAADASVLALEGVKHEYDVGSKTIIDVLEAETQMNSYKINSITTKKNYILAAYKLKASMGELTAKAMNLPVKRFNPDMEFQKVKAKIIGF